MKRLLLRVHELRIPSVLPLLICGILMPLQIFSQTQLLTIEEATGLNRNLYPKRLSQLQWQGNSHSFSWVANDKLVSSTAGKESVDTILDLNTLNASCQAFLEKPLTRFPAITFDPSGTFWFKAGSDLFRFDLATGTADQVNRVNPEAGNTEIEPNTLMAAYTLDDNLFVASGGKEIRITDDGKPGIAYGTSVHRNEFGINKGLFWSPDALSLAFYRMDETMVTEYPLVNIDTRIATANPTRYPMAGMSSHHVKVGVYHLADSTLIYLDIIGDPEQYLTNLTWSPDGTVIYLAILNRDQNHLWLNAYQAADGKFLKTLFEETAEKYVEPQHGLFFLPENPERFIWMSDRDGFTHLYLYNTDGELIKQLTSGHWTVTGFNGFSPSGKEAWFMSNAGNPLGNSLSSVDIKSGNIRLITSSNGTHNDLVSFDGRFILDSYSSFQVVSETVLLDHAGKLIRVLQANQDPLKDFHMGETTVFPILGPSDDTLWCRMIKPVHFDSSVRYPVFIYVYGGPHSQLVTDSWLAGAGFFLNYMAQQGFVVFTLDNRGTANRGRDFEQAIFRNLGTAELEDQMAGVTYLKTLPFVDTARIGINGWSYGGFMTLTMMLRNPGTFRVAVAGGPVIDWQYYEVMYGERYMDTPETNPEGYKTSSLLNYTGNITGDILIIQGYQDETVVPQNALTFLRKCIEENRQIDFFLYPNHSHNVRGKDRVHLNTMISEYFMDHIGTTP